MVATDTQTRTETTTLPASAIRAGDNDRKTFDADELAALAESIRTLGIVQPPTVRPTPTGYELVCGERRYRAMTEILCWQEVPVVVRELSDAEASAAMLAENVSRVDLDPIAEANAYAVRRDAFGMDDAGIAEAFGVPLGRVRSRLALLALAPEIAHLVGRGAIGLKIAALLTRLDVDRQRVAVDTLNRERLDYAGMCVVCERLALAQASESMFDPDSFLVSEEIAAEAKAARVRSRSELESALATALEALERAGRPEAAELRRSLGIADTSASDATDTGPVVAWIRSQLADGPRRAAEILAAASGISERTLRRAKAAAGVRSRRTANGWEWSLA